MTAPTTADGRWIRIGDIGRLDGLDPARRARLVCDALIELGVAQSLVLIHGETRGAEVYALHGGRVRFDDDGEPIIWAGP